VDQAEWLFYLIAGGSPALHLVTGNEGWVPHSSQVWLEWDTAAVDGRIDTFAVKVQFVVVQCDLNAL
jgi:hypothetical protein